MALVHSTGKKHRNTGGILSIFAEIMRQIGGADSGKAFNQRFLSWILAEICRIFSETERGI
jgi:hypothetical protein